MSITTNYGFVKPEVGGSSGSWGTVLNAAFDGIDTTLKAVSDVANAGLPKAGGVASGRIDLSTTTFKRTDKGTVSGSQTLDLADAQFFTLQIGGATILTIANPTAGALGQGFVLRITNGGAAAITWPASFRFPSGAAPALTSAGVDVLVALSHDNGSTWMVTLVMKDVR